MPPMTRWTRRAWCRHLVPDGSVYAFLADHRHQLFPPELFADLTRQGGGHPSVPAEVVATVMVLQALEGLSDREAISALRRDIAWKVACGLRLDDEGFHPTVLVYWRNRIRDLGAAAADLRGGPPGRGGRPGCSRVGVGGCWTPPSWRMRSPPRTRSPSWSRRSAGSGGWSRPAREVELAAHDYDRPGKPECAWDDPQATQALVSGLVNDALALLAAVAEVELGRRAGRGGRAAGAGRRPRRRAGRAARELADRPQGRHRIG